MKLSRRTKSILVILGGLAVIVLTWNGLGQHYPQINEWLYLPERLYRTLRTLMGSDPVSSSLPPAAGRAPAPATRRQYQDAGSKPLCPVGSSHWKRLAPPANR